MVEHILPTAARIMRHGRDSPIRAVTHGVEDGTDTLGFSVPSPALYASRVCVLATPADGTRIGPIVALLKRRTGAAFSRETEKRMKPVEAAADFKPTLTRLSCKPRCSRLRGSRGRPPPPRLQTSSGGGTVLPRGTGIS